PVTRRRSTSVASASAPSGAWRRRRSGPRTRDGIGRRKSPIVGPRPFEEMPGMVRRRRVSVLLGAGRAIAGPAVALAQTAEEAVAYGFMGLADGATFERATTTMSWREASTSPAVFDGDADIGGKRAKIQFTVTAIDPCRYEVALEGPMVP